MSNFIDIVTEYQDAGRYKNQLVIYPDYNIYDYDDVIVKGGELQAFWDGQNWIQGLDQFYKQIDLMIDQKYDEVMKEPEVYGTTKGRIKALRMKSAGSNQFRKLNEVIGALATDDVAFNTKLFFLSDTPKREDYSTVKMTYDPAPGETPAFDEMFRILYDPDDLLQVMWLVGAVLTGEMHKHEKFLFLYGEPGSGKGTLMSVLVDLFGPYQDTISLSGLGSFSQFATQGVKEVQVLIDHDCDVSRIQTNENMLKLISHEPVMVEKKRRDPYPVVFPGLLIAASNKILKIKGAEDGIQRRAVIVQSTSNKHSKTKYNQLMKQIKFELPFIAQKCIDVYKTEGKNFINNLVSTSQQLMMQRADPFHDFVTQYADELSSYKYIRLSDVKGWYTQYLTDNNLAMDGLLRKIKDKLPNYFVTFYSGQKRYIDENGIERRHYGIFETFRKEQIGIHDAAPAEEKYEGWLKFDCEVSYFDSICKALPAQLANADGNPTRAWSNVDSTLIDIDTSKLHWVKVEPNHIVIDFDIKNDEGTDKDLNKNLAAANRFPETYAELSKSGKGIHLHYWYDGDPMELAGLYGPDVEIKKFPGNASLRRQLSMCNNMDMSTLATGSLPLKEKKDKMYKNSELLWTEQNLRASIIKACNGGYHGGKTAPSVDLIIHMVEQAVDQGIPFDLNELRMKITMFAAGSTNQADRCLKRINNDMIWTNGASDDNEIVLDALIAPDEALSFYDVEVFPNLFMICWKKYGKPEMYHLINPSADEVKQFIKDNQYLVGFNSMKYDDRMIYAAATGSDCVELYDISQKIINLPRGQRDNQPKPAVPLSYADIYDYSTKKQGLKKWEIELGIKHDAWEHPWDQPVPEELWDRVLEYCYNDVEATEAVFEATRADYVGRCMLAEMSELPVITSTQHHAAKVLFGTDPKPQQKFVYTDLATQFPGYTFDKYRKPMSMYRDLPPSEGGYVYAQPGIWKNVAVLDVASMHPNSALCLNYFGPYTQNYRDIIQIRLDIKAGDLETAKTRFGGKLAHYLNDPAQAKDLSFALKIIINIVYGLSSAKFDNKFRHPMNQDNIIAKRGALFMIDLQRACEERGYTVVHIKTDSIKIADCTQEAIDFVFKFGEEYGYDFEHESTYDKFCLVNNAVYIAKEGDKWETTGAMFQQPYVFRKLLHPEETPFGKEFYSLTKNAKSPIFLGDTFVGKTIDVYACEHGEPLMKQVEDKDGNLKMDNVVGCAGANFKKATDYDMDPNPDINYYDGLLLKAMESVVYYAKSFDEIKFMFPNMVDSPKFMTIYEAAKELVDVQKEKEAIKAAKAAEKAQKALYEATEV